jgi:hypothetical protein
MSCRFILLLLALCGSVAKAAESPRVAGNIIEIKREAEAGNPKSQKLLADHLVTSSQFSAAEHWYRAASIHGDASALCALGELYQSERGAGTNLVKASATNAIVLHRLAALQGHGKSHTHLYNAYKLGKGLPRDLIQAYKHLLLSDTPNRDDAAKEMVLVMTQQQITRAENEAKSFKPLDFPKAFEELVFQSISVGGTMGTAEDRVAFINGVIISPGANVRIKVGGLPAVIKCTAITRESVTIAFNRSERTINFARPNPTLVRSSPGLTAR